MKCRRELWTQSAGTCIRSAIGQFIDYVIDPNLISGSMLDATLTWYRHVGRNDNGNGLVDAGDSFFCSSHLSNLNLQVLRDGNLIAQSISSVDNLEHLHIPINNVDQYTLRVFGANVFGGTEQFALAWYSTAVPEPSCVAGGGGDSVSFRDAQRRCC